MVVADDDLYGGSYRLFTRVMPRFGVRFSYVDATRPEEIAKAMEPATRFVWIESRSRRASDATDSWSRTSIATARARRPALRTCFAVSSTVRGSAPCCGAARDGPPRQRKRKWRG